MARKIQAITAPKISAQERQWMAEDDLRALTRADEIKADPKRMRAVKQAAKRVVKEKQREVQSIRKISGKQMKSMKLSKRK